MIRSLFRGGYLTVEKFQDRDLTIAELKVTNKACYDALSKFEMNFYAVKSLGQKILNCLRSTEGTAKFNNINI